MAFPFDLPGRFQDSSWALARYPEQVTVAAARSAKRSVYSIIRTAFLQTVHVVL